MLVKVVGAPLGMFEVHELSNIAPNRTANHWCARRGGAESMMWSRRLRLEGVIAGTARTLPTTRSTAVPISRASWEARSALQMTLAATSLAGR